MIAGYAGRSDKLDRALAASPAPTPTRPRPTTRRLVAAVRAGRLPVTEGALDRGGSAFRPG